jgi:hypothetical protein
VPEIPGLQGSNGKVVLSRYDGQDLCRGSQWGYNFVSARMKAWLEANVAEWVRFEPAVVE